MLKDECRCVDCLPSCIGKCECQETKEYQFERCQS